MIAGEYAVLEPSQKAVVASVNRFVTVTASFSVSSISTVSVPKLGLRDVRWIYDESGVTGKPSGAGGGDCGIGIIQMGTNSDVTNSQKLRTDWEQAGIEPLNIAITHRGAMVSQLPQ